MIAVLCSTLPRSQEDGTNHALGRTSKQLGTSSQYHNVMSLPCTFGESESGVLCSKYAHRAKNSCSRLAKFERPSTNEIVVATSVLAQPIRTLLRKKKCQHAVTCIQTQTGYKHVYKVMTKMHHSRRSQHTSHSSFQLPFVTA